MKALRDWRARIDAIDAKLLRLLSERARCALEIGSEKAANGAPVRDAARERAVLERAQRENPGPLSDRAVARVFGTIVEECRKAQSGAGGKPEA
ncbi:MAG: chorismate mutase [Lentisphaerae bacterium]|nr:chorismate mutase [Lentisphaerota bacterium]